jgi:hypothetical protein
MVVARSDPTARAVTPGVPLRPRGAGLPRPLDRVVQARDRAARSGSGSWPGAAYRFVQQSCWDTELDAVFAPSRSGALGNVPRDFTYLRLISAAVSLDRALDR